MKRIRMSWEMFEGLKASNEFRTGEYEDICAIELSWVGTVGSSNSVMEHRAHEILDSEVILEAHMFQRLYETYEEFRERDGMNEESALDLTFRYHEVLLRSERFKDKYRKQVILLLSERWEDEWRTFHNFENAHEDLEDEDITAEEILQEARDNVPDQQV